MRFGLILAAALITATTAQAQTITRRVGPPLPDSNAYWELQMHTGGRSANAGYPYVPTRHWPGAYWEGRFKGTSVVVRFSDGADRVNVLVDGKIVDQETKPAYTDVAINRLPDGDHTIRVEAISENPSSQAPQTLTFGVGGQDFALPPPEPRSHQIEFVGDSFTVGYGNTANKRQCTQDEIWATTDNAQAFGPLTAKHYDADYQINAISGRGIVRNYNGFAAAHLPEAYPYASFDAPGANYADPAWNPQIMVVWLGTNDFSTPLNAGEKWPARQDLQADYEATYVKFVQDLRARNPNTFFILMAQRPTNGELASEVQKVIARLTASGERRIAFLPAPSLNFGGCDGHPDTGDDRAIADSLIAFIDARPDIWQGK